MSARHILGALLALVLLIWSVDLYVESGAGAKLSPDAPALAAVVRVEQYLGLPVPQDEHTVPSALTTLLSRYDGKSLSLDSRTKSSECQVQGPLPDPACTPGAVFASAGTSTICVSGYTRTVRNVSVKTKQIIYRAYGIDYPQPTGTYEADHLIPLELGGSNDIANLFPEAQDPRPGFREKDLVENYLHDQVCAGNISLSAAQEQIARDWVAVYDTFSDDTIAALKKQAARYGD